MCNIAVISVHTSPLSPPGTRDSGGMNVYIRELSREMARRAHSMDIFTSWVDLGSPEVTIVDERTRVIQIRAGGPDADKRSLPRFMPHFLQGVLDFQKRAGRSYDLVHSHYWLSGRVGHALKQRWEVPHVIMFHTLGEAKNQARLAEQEPYHRIAGERLLAQGADRIICASQSEYETLLDQYQTPPSRIMSIPCGVDTERFRPLGRTRARRILGLPFDSPLALFVGRLDRLKGIDILLQATAEVQTDFRLLLIGGDAKDAKHKAELQQMAADLGITDRILFLDAVPHDTIPLYYNAADVCVVPSYYESFGMVALEAMACGIPVVASRVGGLQETVRDGQTGFLVPWRSPSALAARLDQLLLDHALRRRLGREARSAAERFRWSEVATQVENVYHEMVSQYRGTIVGAHVA